MGQVAALSRGGALPADILQQSNIQWADLGIYIGTSEPTLKTYTEWNASRTGYWAWIDISAAGAQTFSVTSSGGMVIGGIAAIVREYSVASFGGMVIGGAAAIDWYINGAQTFVYTSEGGMVLGGAAGIAAEVVIASTGGMIIGGAATAYGEVADTVAPTLQSATIPSAGDSITLVFDEVVNIGSGGSGGFSLDCSVTGTVTMSYSSGDGSDTLVFTLSDIVESGETVTIDYTQPGDGIEDTAGNDLASISGGSVTNNSTQTGSSNITIFADTTNWKQIRGDEVTTDWSVVEALSTGGLLITIDNMVWSNREVYDYTQYTDISRLFLEFDLSALAGKTIVSAELRLYGRKHYNNGSATAQLMAQKSTHSGLSYDDFNNFEGLSFGDTGTISTSDATRTITFNGPVSTPGTGLYYLQGVVGGTAKIAIRDNLYDYGTSTPAVGDGWGLTITMPSVGSGNEPRLYIVYQ